MHGTMSLKNKRNMLWFGVVSWTYWKTRKLKLMQLLFLYGRQHDNFSMNNEEQHLSTNSPVAWSTIICLYSTLLSDIFVIYI